MQSCAQNKLRVSSFSLYRKFIGKYARRHMSSVENTAVLALCRGLHWIASVWLSMKGENYLWIRKRRDILQIVL